MKLHSITSLNKNKHLFVSHLCCYCDKSHDQSALGSYNGLITLRHEQTVSYFAAGTF